MQTEAVQLKKDLYFVRVVFPMNQEKTRTQNISITINFQEELKLSRIIQI